MIKYFDFIFRGSFMNILAFDTTGKSSAVALFSDDVLMAEIVVDSFSSHSQTILPTIQKVLLDCDFSVSDLDYVACSVGPGSFTGIRIGVATAKGLALPTDLKIIPVPTLLALAYNVFDSNAIICPILDARRGQVYSNFFRFVDGLPTTLGKEGCFLFDDVFQRALDFGEDVIFVGDAVSLYRERILSDKLSVASEDCLLSSGKSVALAGSFILNDNPDIVNAPVEPVYLKMAQAERELIEKNGGVVCEN